MSSQDRKLVWSSEDGSLEKPMRGKRDRKAPRKPTRNTGGSRPGGEGVRVHREKKGRGGKVVCVITGLALPKEARKALLKQLKAKLGAGGALKGDTLEIQGDHRDKLLALLAEAGIPAKTGGG